MMHMRLLLFPSPLLAPLFAGFGFLFRGVILLLFPFGRSFSPQGYPFSWFRECLSVCLLALVLHFSHPALLRSAPFRFVWLAGCFFGGGGSILASKLGMDMGSRRVLVGKRLGGGVIYKYNAHARLL